MNWTGRGRKESWPNARYYLYIFLEELRKTTKNFSQDSQSLGKDMNPGPLEYEIRVITTQPLHSVIR
jgi:hypothetical protein